MSTDPNEQGATPLPRRFMTLEDVQEALNVSHCQGYALVHSDELPAIQLDGCGVWRVEHAELEAYSKR